MIGTANAKINIYLEILGKDRSGFHQLETVFQAIDLNDQLHIEEKLSPGISMSCSDPQLSCDSDNLCLRAAAAYESALGHNLNLHIHLDKHIPMGGGLGGGSSNAACVLRLLQERHEHALDPQTLHTIAAELGSDVPFFLYEGTAWATGRGTELEPMPNLPRTALTILRPECSCPTPRIFSELTDKERGPRTALGKEVLSTRINNNLATSFFNRLSPAACRLFPPLKELLAALEHTGLPHLMSGSGSCCFVLGHIEAPIANVSAWHCYTA